MVDSRITSYNVCYTKLLRFEYEVIEMIRNICELKSKDKIVIVKGDRGAFEHGSSNSIRIIKLKEPLKKKTFSSFC